MAIRQPLRDHITNAWMSVVDVDYDRQRINSERSLQASLWSQLNQRIPHQFRMFIEPRFTLGDGTRFFPDIVVCNSRSIICVIEIKYQPRVQPSFRKDLRTLDTLCRHGDSLSLQNQRFSGPSADDSTYHFAANTLFAWAGIHRPARRGSFATLGPIIDGFASLHGRFLQLHAETDPNHSPVVFHRNC